MPIPAETVGLLPRSVNLRRAPDARAGGRIAHAPRTAAPAPHATASISAADRHSLSPRAATPSRATA